MQLSLQLSYCQGLQIAPLVVNFVSSTLSKLIQTIKLDRNQFRSNPRQVS